MTAQGHDTVLLSLGDTQSQVQVTGEDGASQVFALALGLDAVTPGPFRRDPPTPLELEQAIMVVEDVLMPLAARIPPHPVLHLQSPVPLAEVLGGRELPRERRVAAALLILREWMHHLDAGSVALVD